MQSAVITVETPIGIISIVGNESAIHEVTFAKRQGTEPTALLRKAAEQLQAYMAGQAQSFDLPLEPKGTPFQQSVWKALREIPYGETINYGEVARRIKNPRASQAVGQAVGANPLCIVIPCHRVVASNGIGGYAYGLKPKRWLLGIEGVR